MLKHYYLLEWFLFNCFWNFICLQQLLGILFDSDKSDVLHMLNKCSRMFSRNLKTRTADDGPFVLARCSVHVCSPRLFERNSKMK